MPDLTGGKASISLVLIFECECNSTARKTESMIMHLDYYERFNERIKKKATAEGKKCDAKTMWSQ